MKITRLLLFVIVTVFLTHSVHSQPKIIFDTDFGGDADDLGALVMLHHFVDQGECYLLGIMSWSMDKYTVPAIDAVNQFYGHPDIPIGTRKDSLRFDDWNYSKPITDNFPYKCNYEDVPDATTLYRELLSENPDSSVTIVTVGPLKNIADLLKSEGDTISTLSGKELIEKKVKEFVIMGGKFPQGDWEWNFSGDMPGVTKFVISQLTVPITFTGYEVGMAIKTGKVLNTIDPENPLTKGYRHFSEHAHWDRENFTGKILDNATYDQTAVLYAVRNGVGTYWDRISNGVCVPDNNGGNTWIEGVQSKHSYLQLTMDEEKIARKIEYFMLGDF
ncbi:MAG: nucleoside hydrolase [Candidatus Marinimicrobia bacterium]|nr:nucleoside hydrolase [Candidatus Neomarinimicrobiota bacterium]